MENVELDEDLAESRLIVIYHNDVCWISKICWFFSEPSCGHRSKTGTVQPCLAESQQSARSETTNPIKIPWKNPIHLIKSHKYPHEIPLKYPISLWNPYENPASCPTTRRLMHGGFGRKISPSEEALATYILKRPVADFSATWCWRSTTEDTNWLYDGYVMAITGYISYMYNIYIYIYWYIYIYYITIIMGI